MREGDPEWERGVPVRVEAVPVRSRRRTLIAVLARDTNLVGDPLAQRARGWRTCAAPATWCRWSREGTFPFAAGFADPPRRRASVTG